MKLVVPHTGELQPSDARLIRLAQFLGVSCEPLFLQTQAEHHREYMEKLFAAHGRDCLVVNPKVMHEWTGDVFPADLVSFLLSRFPYMLVHGLSTDAFGENLVKSLSGGRVHSVRPVADAGQLYEISPNSRDVCGAFSGLSFGPINADNDRVLSVGVTNTPIRTLISIGGRPFMALVKHDDCEVVILAGQDTADLNDEVGGAPLTEYFSRFVPYAMALRYIFGEQCWHACEHHASIIVDDPLLQPNYGYLNFESLLRLMEIHNFATTIAFIPHNYRRNSGGVVQMFRDHSDRFAICFHGNDHTEGELASADTSWLNTMMRIAETRMSILRQSTGLPCHKVMVFPQGNFSVDAMKVLKSRNFCAAVNTVPHPADRAVALTLGELAQPAVLRYGGFPLFLRKPMRETKAQDVAFNLFFGRPILVVEHHDIFRRPEALAEVASMINSLAPEMRWSDLGTAVMSSTLKRKASDGVCHIQAYSAAVRLANDVDSPKTVILEWSRLDGSPSIEQVLDGGTPYRSFEVDDSAIRVFVELAPRSSRTFSVVYRNDYSSLEGLGFKWSAKAFVRRRLSEVRDNYISKNQYALNLAKALHRRIGNGRGIATNP